MGFLQNFHAAVPGRDGSRSEQSKITAAVSDRPISDSGLTAHWPYCRNLPVFSNALTSRASAVIWRLSGLTR
jgi:hypothetical protein